MLPRILLTSSKILALETDSDTIQEQGYLSPCRLKWKQQKLWVSLAEREEKITLPALKNKQWLIDCLRCSSLEQVCIDMKVREKDILNWADICEQSHQQVLLRIRSDRISPKRQQKLWWHCKRAFDWIIAALLLLTLSPIVLILVILMRISSPGSVFCQQWCVGERGKLFKILKFRTTAIDVEQQDASIVPLDCWLRKYRLDGLPQLFNVMRGEMSIVGPSPWTLSNALKLGSKQKQRLNALPGMTGTWQIQNRSKLLNLDAVTNCDLEYLSNWSLAKDLRILLMSVPKFISGFGAY